MRLSVGNRILSVFGVVLGVFLVFGILIYTKVEKMQKASIAQTHLSTIKFELQNMAILHHSQMFDIDEALHKKELPTFSTAYEECKFTKWRSDFKFTDLSLTAEFDTLIIPHKTLHKSFEEIIFLLKNKEYEKAREVYETRAHKNLQVLLTLYPPLYEQIEMKHHAIDRYREILVEEMKTLLLIALLILFSVIVVFYLWLKQSMISPVAEMTEIAKNIAQGDMQQMIAFNANDEIGELANAFREMVTSNKKFSDIAHQIGEGNLSVTVAARGENDILGIALENMLTNLNGIMQDLKEGTFALNSATAGILATTSQVSSGASQTYAAVAQTSASIEQIKQTAKVSSGKGTQTAGSASKTMGIAKSETEELNENMRGLNQIKTKMDLIASNIIQLSDQSQLIGEIITTVEDIANQSNMLAVNASIEAVKAGEQGKGFSVVAQELKNLAEQSKSGTKQVQKILFDIQKVTATLVMVAEQGGKAVENGVKQISESYDQELAGMDQISGAMGSIKEATSQNLSSIKQVEMSAKDLSALSQKLKEVMSHYTIAQMK